MASGPRLGFMPEFRLEKKLMCSGGNKGRFRAGKIPGPAELSEPKLQEYLSVLGLHGGKGLTGAGPPGTRGLPHRGKNMAHLGIQNPLDQYWAKEHFAKLFKNDITCDYQILEI